MNKREYLAYWRRFTAAADCRYRPLPSSKDNRDLKTAYPLSGSDLKGVYFTRREAEAVLCVVQGKTMKETGRQMNVSPRTVEYYLQSAKLKLGVRKKRHLIRKVLDSDFLDHVDF